MKFIFMRWLVYWAQLLDALLGIFSLGFYVSGIGVNAMSWYLDNTSSFD